MQIVRYIANTLIIYTLVPEYMNMDHKEKSIRFQRLAAKRTTEVLDRLRILGNCSDSRSYAYNEEEIDKIFRAIEEQVKIVKAQFKKPKKGFKL
jgi:hypothetical protein